MQPAPARLQQIFAGRWPRGLFFDLDGTLLDSVPDLATAVDQMLAGLGLPAAGEERVRGWVGEGARVLVQRALEQAAGPAASDAAVDDALGRFLSAYEVVCCERTRPYDGVAETLAQLGDRRIAMACITNKPGRFTGRLLHHYGLARWLPLSLSGDSLPVRKPDPGPLIEAARRLGLPLADCAMIGDSIHDVAAARAAGMPAVAVSYGYHGGRDLGGADLVIDHFGELLLP